MKPGAGMTVRARIRWQVALLLILQAEIAIALVWGVWPADKVWTAILCCLPLWILAYLLWPQRFETPAMTVRPVDGADTKELQRRMLERLESERTQIARALHDEVGQPWAIVKIQLQMAKLETLEIARSKIEECLQVVDRGVSQSRNLALHVHPSILDDFGLTAALEWFVTDKAAAGTDVKLRSEVGDKRFPSQSENAAYRIIVNAVEHLLAEGWNRGMVVHAQQEGSELVVAVTAAGQDAKKPNNQTASLQDRNAELVLLQRQAELLGGRLAQRAEPNGIHLEARLPLGSS
jgi:signal transduction histidine kinase